MSKIFWDKDKVAFFTKQLDAVEHSHWMMQLFLGLEDNLDIYVSGKRIFCKGIIVNKNISHSFSANDKQHFSALIEPTSSLATQINIWMNGQEFFILDSFRLDQLQKSMENFSKQMNITAYHDFINQLYTILHIKEYPKIYDDRIVAFFHLLDNCTCNTHSIAQFAQELSLSQSRLSHLFREQVGVPLKSYLLLHQMERAFMELFDGKTITDAAMLSGFDSPSHFAATTKRMMGIAASLSLKDSEFLKVYPE